MNTFDRTDSESVRSVKDLEFSLTYQKRTYELLLRQKDRASEVFSSIMSEGFSEMNQALSEFRNGIDQIVEAITEISSATEDITNSVQEQRDTAVSMNKRISEIASSTADSHSMIEGLGKGMEELQKSSITIGTLIHNIEDIAETLNVLSINGAIQAARSGDMGQGFAVVTGEMRKLALNVKDSATTQMGVVKTVIEQINESAGMSRVVRGGMEENKASMEQTDKDIDELRSHLDIVASSTSELAASVHEFSATIEQISRSISSIEEMMDRISSNFEANNMFNRRVSASAWSMQDLASSSSSLEMAAQKQVQQLRQTFVDSGGVPDMALVRIFLSLPYSGLPRKYQQEIESSGNLPGLEDRYLCLMGTAGDEPDWNEVTGSKGHKYMRLPEHETGLTDMPMIQKVFSEFGVPYSSIIHPDESEDHAVEGYFVTDDPTASPYIPDKKFVNEYGIHSQISIGGVLPSGSIFTMFIFTKSRLSHDMAETISVFGPILQISFKDFDDTGRYWL